MQFTTATIAAFAATAFAVPAVVERQAGLCSSGTPVCCATDVLQLANLDCAPPAITPTAINEFIDTCAEGGQQAKCCLIPILGQALICSDVNPTAEAPATAAAA
ncbi:hypothetical protein IAQ61_006581 [Plenodomus lingam]|uniref:Hydrophobin n=1 Tax=Leptosphaeria maculans (strain JN3 / isolate v23.1.3 / race Av1-4-5-6-7-8) TaxID=985895 RepID=E5AFJ9_LEPMJ|nr:hypothetical protein LEMA_P007750.1 [Plenodomus lingam JN3]KAH9869375.1 hypothetical protein IAQ61_006581 [Plenodomus lingam]CBY01988.1 hypothetical protein LEMA_P007750.1 [Plenodomus lingam JN3]